MASVLFVDDDVDLRDVMQVSIGRISNHSCLAVGSFAEVQQERAQVLDCELAILDINLGKDNPSGLHVFGWLRLNGFKGTIVFLTGHGAHDPRVIEAAKFIRAKVYPKPVTGEILRQILSEMEGDS